MIQIDQPIFLVKGKKGPNKHQVFFIISLVLSDKIRVSHIYDCIILRSKNVGRRII
jgi:hypothetical protein